jgi:hypothetical protein
MSTEETEWHIVCDAETFAKCRKDEKFPYIVTLARAVNALNFVHSVMIYAEGNDDPGSRRNRFNSYLFGSAIMYEVLRLVRAMNQPFVGDDTFQNGLRLLLKDTTAQQIERTHLNPARHGAVFHFDPGAFSEMIGKATRNEAPFISALGNRSKDRNYAYADIVAGEILVGLSTDTEEFYTILEDAMAKTRDLVIKFTKDAERLIVHHLKIWGFQKQ